MRRAFRKDNGTFLSLSDLTRTLTILLTSPLAFYGQHTDDGRQWCMGSKVRGVFCRSDERIG